MKRKSLIVSMILVVLLIASLVVTATACGPKTKTALAAGKLEVKMYDTDANTLRYYVGDDSALDLFKAFPDAESFSSDSDMFADNTIEVVAGDKGTLNVKYKAEANKKDEVYNVYGVEAINVYGDEMEAVMHEELAFGTNVVMHQDLTTKTGETFRFSEGATLYGNGHTMYADSIAAPRNTKKDKSSWGASVFALGDSEEVSALNIQDLHIFVNKPIENDTRTLEDFEFSGAGIDISASIVNGKKDYDYSNIKNVIVENGQKLLHVNGANVNIEGCIFRNGADANIASGTSPKKGSTINIKNSVSANSMVAGFLFYGFEKVNKGSTRNQQTLNIEGFFDIYNWKDGKTAKLVPATEGFYAGLVNDNVQKELKGKNFEPYVYYKKGDPEKYAHIGIIRLATGSCQEQNPTITYNGKGGQAGKNGLQPQYAEVTFPIPKWTKSLGILKHCDMVSYKPRADYGKNETPYIMPGDPIPDTIYADMAFGRKGWQ